MVRYGTVAALSLIERIVMKIAYWLWGLGVFAFSLLCVSEVYQGGQSFAHAQQEKPSKSVKTESTPRVTNGLIAFYDFASTKGATVYDRSGVAKPIHLRIASSSAVRRAKGALEIRGKTIIRSDGNASRLNQSVRQSNQLTVEAWIKPASRNQSGPARIVTISRDSSNRNFTLGQDGDRFDARLRSTKSSKNGMPSISSPSRSLDTRLTHVVYTYDRRGRAMLYINGQLRGRRTLGGKASNWDGRFHLALANELSHDRPWRGTYYLVALYGRGLSQKEIEQNYRAGAGVFAPPTRMAAKPKIDPKSFVATPAAIKHFETKIAPLLARQCLECHGWKSRKGQLDLSRKVAALKGGKDGPAIVPGDPESSLLWESVDFDDMPKDRPPLSRGEKQLLHDWIKSGAIWSGTTIARADYAPDRPKGENWIQRLTVRQYIRTVRHTVGVDIAADARKLLPRDLRADGFSNTAYNLNVDLGHVEAYARLAQLIVQRMDVQKFASVYSKSRQFSDANMRTIIKGMGRWLLRGPVNESEIGTYLTISKAVAKEGGSFSEAVSYIVEAMLQAPRFIYRIENQAGDGKPRRVTGYELASRMSYILWGAPPDRKLLDAAGAGDLADVRKVRAQIGRMLNDPRAVEQSIQFIHEWLNLERLENLRPDRKHYPKWNGQLAIDMRRETTAFFENVVWKQEKPLSALFNAQITYLTPRLARHYGITPQKSDFARYDLTGIPSRGGLLTQGSTLTIGGNEASMVARGLFVLHDILRGKVDDPPPGLDTTPVPAKPGLSNRGVSIERIKDQSCGSCHSKFEPLAFGLEKFDGVGAYQEKDRHGNRLREDGEVLFPGSKKAIAFTTSGQLMDLLAGSSRVAETITWKMTQFSLGRPIVKKDIPTLDTIHKAAMARGGTYQSVITAIIMSDLVQKVQTESRR